MEKRRNSGLIGRARRVLMVGVPAVGLAVGMVGAAPAGQALAQQNNGGSIDIGASIADTVTAAVSAIATNGGNSTVTGSESVESSDLEFGDTEGTAISDSSGGDYNVGANPGNND
jgi:hypothetical protein